MSENLDRSQDEFDSADNIVEEAEESTIFSAPTAHKDKPPKAKGRDIKKFIIIALACVAVVIGAIGSKHLYDLTKKEELDSQGDIGFGDEQDSTLATETIDVIKTDSSIFESVVITNKNGDFKFVKQQIVSTDENGEEMVTDYWTLEGVDQSKLSSMLVEEKITAASEVVAIQEITERTAEDCGLDKPVYKVVVTAKDKDPYTILVGGDSPDGMGSYLMIEGGDIIYLVDKSSLSTFDFEALDLADRSSIPATMFTVDTSDNKSEDGAYAYFDSLTVEGKLFPEKITIVNNNEQGDSAQFKQYLITTPDIRYAQSENLSSALGLFSNELAVSGCYAFDINDETLKKFGLDNPDAVITLTIKGESKSFKFSKIDDEYAAVIYDGATMIRKVSLSTLTFMNYQTEDFYMTNLFFYHINDISSLAFKGESLDVRFDISYVDGSDGDKIYTIKVGDTELVASKFQTIYSSMVGIMCEDFALQEVGNSVGTLTLVFTDKTQSVIEFYKVNATQYQYSIDGKQMGKISSSAYNKMVNDIDRTAKGE